MSLILLLLLLMMMVMILMLIMMVNGDTYVHDQSKIWCVPVPSCSLETLMSFQEIEGVMLYFSIFAHINVSGTVQCRYTQAGTAINVKE